MSTNDKDAAARRERIADAVNYMDRDTTTGHRLREFLEEPLKDEVNGDRYPVVGRGSATAIFLVKRAFASPDDGKKHYGLFDPKGHPSALPFRTSKWSE